MGLLGRKSLLRNDKAGSAPISHCCWLEFDCPDRLCNIPALSMGAGSVKLGLRFPVVMHQLKRSQFTGGFAGLAGRNSYLSNESNPSPKLHITLRYPCRAFQFPCACTHPHTFQLPNSPAPPLVPLHPKPGLARDSC